MSEELALQLGLRFGRSEVAAVAANGSRLNVVGAMDVAVSLDVVSPEDFSS
jgi:hypothetical protein